MPRRREASFILAIRPVLVSGTLTLRPRDRESRPPTGTDASGWPVSGRIRNSRPRIPTALGRRLGSGAPCGAAWQARGCRAHARSGVGGLDALGINKQGGLHPGGRRARPRWLALRRPGAGLGECQMPARLELSWRLATAVVGRWRKLGSRRPGAAFWLSGACRSGWQPMILPAISIPFPSPALPSARLSADR